MNLLCAILQKNKFEVPNVTGAFERWDTKWGVVRLPGIKPPKGKDSSWGLFNLLSHKSTMGPLFAS
jgi:hypothetical protein